MKASFFFFVACATLSPALPIPTSFSGLTHVFGRSERPTYLSKRQARAGTVGAVFITTNEPDGNQVVVSLLDIDGKLVRNPRRLRGSRADIVCVAIQRSCRHWWQRR
jgi:hypothetical protein